MRTGKKAGRANGAAFAGGKCTESTGKKAGPCERQKHGNSIIVYHPLYPFRFEACAVFRAQSKMSATKNAGFLSVARFSGEWVFVNV